MQIDAQQTEEVQGKCGLVNFPIPKMKWELGVTSAETCDQVVFAGLYCSFHFVGVVEVGWDQLKIDTVWMHKLLQSGRTFVVEHLKLGSETFAGCRACCAGPRRLCPVPGSCGILGFWTKWRCCHGHRVP